MARKLIYNELEQMVNEIEKDLLEYKRANENALKAIEELALIFNAVPGHIAVIDSQSQLFRHKYGTVREPAFAIHTLHAILPLALRPLSKTIALP